MEQALLLGFCAALVGWSFAGVMSEGVSPFAWYFDILAWLNRKNKAWKCLTYPLGGCAICFSGQIAFWSAWEACHFSLTYPVACSVATSAGCAITTAFIINEL